MSIQTILNQPVVMWKILRCRLRGQSIDIGTGCYISPSASISTGDGYLSIGKNGLIQKGAVLSTYGGRIQIGDNVSINPYCILYGHGGLKIGNDVRIAAHVVVIAAEHVFEDKKNLIRKQGLTHIGIEIGNDVWLGAGAKILDGVKIADGCVIGANAVVSSDTDAYGVYVGVPARKIKERT